MIKIIENFRILKNTKIIGITLWPFIIFRDNKDKISEDDLRHERIHILQQQELLVVGFYILYLISYLINCLKYNDHEKAYGNIIFEKEAYDNQGNKNYFAGRKMFAWTKYIK